MDTFFLLRFWAARNTKHKASLAHHQKITSSKATIYAILFVMSEGPTGPEIWLKYSSTLT